MKPSRKLKKHDAFPKLILEEVIGSTTKNSNGLASCISNSCCVYVAGCVVVVYNVNSGTQSHLVVSNRMPKPLSCVAVSRNGNFVAAGESGHQAAVLVWDSVTSALVSELKGHQYGVECLEFSPDGKHLASVGFAHDGYLCLWDWRSGILVTKLRASSSCSAVASISFSSDAKFIVTAGKRHLKLWSVGSSTRTHVNSKGVSLALHGKPVNLGHHRGCSFVAVTSPVRAHGSHLGSNPADELLPIYALTDSGVLCLLQCGLSIINSVDLKVEKGFALSASNKFVASACNNGVVKLVAVDSFKYTASLLYSEAKRGSEADNVNSQPLHTLPDAIACQFSHSEKLVVVYRDQSLYIWDISDVTKATRHCVLVSHSACIWDIRNLPCENMHDPSLACVARGCSGGVSFATCSADGTIRLWDLALQPVLPKVGSSIATDDPFVISEAAATTCLVSAGLFERTSFAPGASIQEFRSMAVSSDGKHVAAGDSQGNLHIFNLYTSDYMFIQDAHEAEILSLCFSSPIKKDVSIVEVSESHYFLASGGRDQMIHLYDVERNFDLVGTIDNHSAAVTSVKFTCDGCKVLSSGADKSLVFHDVTVTDTGYKISRSHHQMASHGTIYDMVLDPIMEAVVTLGQDKKINTFSIASGKPIRSFKQDGDFGDPIKVSIDPSCTFMVCSYSNKSICMYDFIKGEMVARAAGHGELVTGLIFLPDCKHLVSVGGDGCIFVWKVPAPLSSKMLQRIKKNASPLPPTSLGQPLALCEIKFHEEKDHKTNINPKGVGPQDISPFKFSISRLPKWAQPRVIVPSESNSASPQEVGKQASSPSVGNVGDCAPVHPGLDTPSKRVSEGSKLFPRRMSECSFDSDKRNSSTSSVAQETRRSFALDDRWLTIHTVCLDLLSSPDNWEKKDMNVAAPVSNLSTDQAMETTSSMNNSEPIVQLGTCDAKPCQDEDSDQMQLEITKSGDQETDSSIAKAQNDDLYSMNFSNLSAKLKTGGRKSSGMRRYSSQFVVRRGLLGDQNKVFDHHIQDFGGEIMKKDKEFNSFMQLVEEESVSATDTHKKETEKQKTILACREALLNLDSATDTALDLFSKLGKLDYGEEIFKDSELLYGEMLSSIAKKVHEIAKLAQQSNNKKNSLLDASSFEPLLGTFAESLSQRVVEIVKKNCTTSSS